jgi:tetratricopeptide (TPR) repeat protein
MLTIILQGGAPHSDSAGLGTGVSPYVWWLTQSKVLLMYLRLVAWPWPLSIHYEPPYLTSIGAAWMYVLPVAALVIGSLVLLWRRSAVGYATSFALAILAPTLVVPIATEIAAERRMYLPLAAILVLLVAGGYRLLCHVLSSRAAIWATGIVACLLAVAGGVVSSARLAEYQDEETLWTKVIERDPTNATARYNVGTMYLERGQPQEAAKLFERAIEVRPDYAKAHHNLGAAYSALGRGEEATREFERAVELEPKYALGYVKLGRTALKAGDVAEARKQFDASLRAAPDNPAAHSGIASLLLETGQLDDAIRHAQSAIESDPDNASAHNVLGAALARQQRFDEAIEHFEAAVRLDPSMLQAQGNLMGAYASVGRSQEALELADRLLASARATGDTAMVEQVEAFLAAYQPGDTAPETSHAPLD